MNPLLPMEQLAVLAALVAGVVCWSGWRSTRRLAVGLRTALLLLRAGAVAALLVVALNPGQWRFSRDEEGAEWAVLLDASASMATSETGGDTRWTQAARAARRLRAPEGRSLRLFTFDSALRPVGAETELGADACRGERTDIVGALGQLAERYRSAGRRLGGVVLFSDGRQLPARPFDEVALELRAGRSPVFPVVLGGAVETVNLAIGTRRPHYVAFAGQTLVIDARVRCTGLANIRPRIALLDAAGTVLAERPAAIGTEAEVAVPFKLEVGAAGYRTYRLRIEDWPGEGGTADNTAEFAVNVVDTRMRVLLVEGAPHWDSKFIAQLLQRERHVDVSLVYRLGQDRYFSQLDANRLTAEQAWRALPDSVEALARYDLVVAGRGFECFLDRGSIAALKDYLRTRGGGLIFTRGKPYAGEQPELEPLEPVNWGPEWTQEFVWQPTEAGESEGLFGDGLPGRGDPRWAKLPPLSHAWRTTRTKLFARVLAEGVATAEGRSARVPVVVAQRFGRGQVVTVNSDDLWQWGFFPRVEGAGELYRDFWLRLVDWAAVHAEFLPGHDWSLQLDERRTEVGRPVRLRLATRADPPAEGPTVRVRSGAAGEEEVRPAAVPERNGEYEAVFTPTRPGLHRLEVRVGADPTPRVLETLAVVPPPAETDDVRPDRAWLERLAAATEGRLANEAELQGLLEPPPATEETAALDNARWESCWDRWPWLLAVVGLLAGEWTLRRRHGLT